MNDRCSYDIKLSKVELQVLLDLKADTNITSINKTVQTMLTAIDDSPELYELVRKGLQKNPARAF